MKDLTSYIQQTELAELDPNAMAGALSEAVEESGGTSANYDYLTFSGKAGVWKLGRNGDAPDPDELFILEPSTVLRGWTCWKNSKVAGRYEWPATEPDKAVPMGDLEDHGPYKDADGWKDTWGFALLRCETLRAAKFTSTSVSGCNSIKDLVLEVSKRMGIGEPCMPVLRLAEEEFTAQDQKNWKPMFDIETWATVAEVRAFLAGESTLDELVNGEAKPKARTKKKVAKKKATRRRA